MEDPLDTITLQTLDLLEDRLNRVEFAITGRITQADHQSDVSIPARMQALEATLQNLASSSQTVADILGLQNRHPEFFKTPESANAPGEAETSNLFAMVLAEAPAYPTTASQLTSLNDLQIPLTEAMAKLSSLQPRIDELERTQAQQGAEIAALRQRSAVLLLRWYEISVLGQGKCWAEWDSNLRRAERSVRRSEVRRFKEEAGG